ncbi:methyltransferase [Streptomyces sp. NPDC097619]|uniref:methyltransferase n=1 Tax=Streptomyces sp. NPDC097619 TaxID=3157228 RepID=UPI00331851C3
MTGSTGTAGGTGSTGPRGDEAQGPDSGGDELLPSPWGALRLGRFPEEPRDRLRAWDAADEYLLRYLAGETGEETEKADGEIRALTGGSAGPVVTAGRTVVVLGDRWGALTTGLAARGAAEADGADGGPAGDLVQITDSFLGREATRASLARLVGPGTSDVRLLTSREAPPERVDVLVVRVPKSLALLEDQLHRLAPHLHPGTVVVGTGMVKEIHTSTLKLFERIVGPTRTSLAVRKARLILCAPAADLRPLPNPWPLTYALGEDEGPAAGLSVTSHAGVFCADRLDIGTRFFLANLPRSRGAERVVDLGCGNGVLGAALARRNPAATLVFADESYQAVASAEATFRANHPYGAAEFVVGDGLADEAPGSVDLILNNPPFHSHQATTDTTAWRMFSQARRALRTDGELWVVGNRNLGYHLKLRRLFGNCELIAGDRKFVVLRAVKR